MPPCCLAMLLISSWMSTVLPTPAPPKRPVLPPRVYGSGGAPTLLPVSHISTFVARSAKAGPEHPALGRLLVKGGGGPVDRIGLGGLDRPGLVDRLARDVDDAAEGLLA